MLSRAKPLFSSFLITLFCLLLAACSSADRRTGPSVDEPTPIPTPVAAAKTTYTVELGKVTYEQTVTGRVVPLVEAPLAFPIDGVVKEVFFERDDTVQAGDVIAEVDTAPVEEELIVAEAQLAISQTRLKTTQKQLVIERQRAELDVTLAQLELDLDISEAGSSTSHRAQYQIHRFTLLLQLPQLDLQ